MATLREIRRRIGSVKSTQKITKAMKMVAAAKLRRAQDAVIAARPYARKMKELLQHLASKVDVTAKYLGIFARLDFSQAQSIVEEVVQGFLNDEYDRVELVYNEFKSIIQQRVVIDQVLPIPAAEANPQPKVDDSTRRADAPLAQQSQARGERSRTVDYIYEPSSEAIIASLVPKHLNFQIWRVLLESNAAEQGARMTAMDNATTNASDLIRDLQLSYNKARQASITKELLEIVSGAEALKAAG
ncbi:MAG: F0F1 ATP synthase subunit gamma [Ignavibacteriales bacterium]|nr:F0F1 ATP synthase subunit gamma [Ignavibacteriales bacterium]